MNHCGNCANYVWGDKKTPLPSECITCTTTHVPNGENLTPSHWRALPQTNADHIREMSDEELAEVLGKLAHCGGCPMRDNCKVDDLPCNNVLLEWLKQPAEETEG